MRTRNRLTALETVLGDRTRINSSQLTPKQWGAMAMEALQAAKPQLSRMVGFEELVDKFTGLVDGHSFLRRIYDEKSDMGPTGLEYTPHGDTTLVITIAVTSERDWLDSKKARFSGQFVHRTELLMTRAGLVLIWNWSAERKMENDGFGPKGENPGTYEVATWSCFTCPNDRLLKQMLSLPGVGRKVLHRLKRITGDTVRKREEQLASMKGLDELYDLAPYVQKND